MGFSGVLTVTHNPYGLESAKPDLQSRFTLLKEAGLTKPTAHPALRVWARPLRGPGGWVGDWYLWHVPDGLRAGAATGLGCMQACTGKLGVIE